MSEVEQAAVTKAKRIWSSCYSCRDYAEHRRDAIAVPLADKARREGRDIVEVVDEFMLAAHRRHMAGEPLREDGPTRLTDPRIGQLAALLSPGLFGAATPADSTRAVGHELGPNGNAYREYMRRAFPPPAAQPAPSGAAEGGTR